MSTKPYSFSPSLGCEIRMALHAGISTCLPRTQSKIEPSQIENKGQLRARTYAFPIKAVPTWDPLDYPGCGHTMVV
jgi:hypothetical protein